MSRTVTTKNISIKNTECLQHAVEALKKQGVAISLCNGLKSASHRVRSGRINGIGVQLEGWRYPIVVRENGSVQYDNYDGSWGNISHLDQLLYEYVKQEAVAQYGALGYVVDEAETTVNEQGDLSLSLIESPAQQQHLKIASLY